MIRCRARRVRVGCGARRAALPQTRRSCQNGTYFAKSGSYLGRQARGFLALEDEKICGEGKLIADLKGTRCTNSLCGKEDFEAEISSTCCAENA